MTLAVRQTIDPERVLGEAADFLASDPIRHNLILTLLRQRVALPEPGRFWIVDIDGEPTGVVFQSPLHFMATVTPMTAEAVAAAVDAIVEARVRLPGVNGEAATSACFAGHWSERTKSAAHPDQGQRLYEVEHVTPAGQATGRFRRAVAEDRDLLSTWLEAFSYEVDPGQTSRQNPGEVVERRVRDGELWVWDHEGPVALAGLSHAVSGVARVGPVYTPPDRRGRGYASALVAEVSQGALNDGCRCVLYTDLANPVSNSIYRAIGYRAVAEMVRYRFDEPR
jgi:predicted GNAT family acetyltransferase